MQAETLCWIIIIVVIAILIYLNFYVDVTYPGITVLFFYRDGCPPCDAMKADWRDFVSRKLCKVDEISTVTSYGAVQMKKYGVTGTPCLIVLKDDQEIYRKYGKHTVSQLVDMVVERVRL